MQLPGGKSGLIFTIVLVLGAAGIASAYFRSNIQNFLSGQKTTFYSASRSAQSSTAATPKPSDDASGSVQQFYTDTENCMITTLLKSYPSGQRVTLDPSKLSSDSITNCVKTASQSSDDLKTAIASSTDKLSYLFCKKEFPNSYYPSISSSTGDQLATINLVESFDSTNSKITAIINTKKSSGKWYLTKVSCP